MRRNEHPRRRSPWRAVVAALLAVATGAGVWFAVAGRNVLSSHTSLVATRIGTYPVGTGELRVVEPAAATQPPRVLPTAVWYPETAGPRPLLVFSQGYLHAVATYQPLLTAWASAGYVVVAPTYPRTVTPDPTTPSGPTESDMLNHPADLRFLVHTLLGDATHGRTVLAGRVDADDVGLVGQSDGGDVSLAVADNSAYRTPRVKAVAVLSGAEWAPFGGAYFAGPAVPLLVVQSNADTVNVPACGTMVYDQAPAPKYFLELLGATHMGAYTTPDSYERVVAQVTTRFFDAELAHEGRALSHIGSVGNVAGVSAITIQPTAPAPTGPPDCPAAP